MPERVPLLIVGGGMATARLLATLKTTGYSKSVHVISGEAQMGYNRVLLPDYLADRCTLNDLLPETNWSNGVTSDSIGDENSKWCSISRGVKASSLDSQQQCITLADGQQIFYETLVIATGSDVAVPGVLPHSHPAIYALRTLDDAEHLSRMAPSGRSICVLGGGLLGLEAAHALFLRGHRVTVIHRNNNLMNRQLDNSAADRLRGMLERKGLRFHLGGEIADLQASATDIRSVRLTSGHTVPCDLLLLATGNRPSDGLAKQGKLLCNKGISVNAYLQTSAPNVYALGECASVNGQTYCFVDPVYAQAEALAKTICGTATSFTPPAPNCRLKVAGIELFCAGMAPDELGALHTSCSIVDAPELGVYRCLTYEDHFLRAATLLGDSQGALQITNALNQEHSDSAAREALAFGITYAA